jgi:predicted MFS family arabinose efflux permease
MSPAYTVFGVTFMVGYILFGIALLRASALPRAATLLLIVGAILANLPPGLVPMLILIVGGVVWGIGAAWLGYVLWLGKDDKTKQLTLRQI